jgi:phospholipid-transporting ATPase
MELIAWQELQVGQLLCIENNEELPADVVVLATSEEEGRCFIETANLDGETNLKRRVAVTETCKSVGWRALNAPILDQREVCQAASARLHGSVEYEQPNNQLYTFTGRLLLEDGGTNANAISLGPENIMLRGCGVRSCSFVIGLVIFTGAETKLLQNSRAAPSKQSKLYRTANRCMLLIFVTMFALCLISAIVAAAWNNSNSGRVWYLPSVTADSFGDFVVNFFTFLILYNNLVPISLYVSLDIIKVLQANQITADARMVCDGFRAIARTSDLNEELGQVEYIFSDKTGTLTCNLMEFRKCSIGGVSYGFGTTEIGRAVAAMQKGAIISEGNTENETATNVMVNVGATDDTGASSDRISPASPVLHHHHAVPMSPSSSAAPESDKLGPTADEVKQAGDMRAAQVHHDPSIHFDDPALLKHLATGGEQSERIHEFLTLLSICHTVIPETDPKTGKVAFRASSPDEEALVKAARCLGYNFVAPAPLTKVEVTHKYPATSSSVAQYTILNVNEFNSSRKRMSVVAVNAQNQYVLYCKGADNMMLPRAVASEDDSKMLAHLKAYASEGLRTLVLARRVLTDDEYAAYNQAYIAASTSLTDREEMLDACAEMIEKDMTILGVTAIEDKLQEGVPSTIFDLAQAGIKIWVLTGDREETAINIGHACRLLDDKMQLLYVNAEDVETLEKQLDALFNAPQVQALMKSNRCAPDLAMICDGKALVHVFPSKEALRKCSSDANGNHQTAARARELAKKLLSVASVCKALVACRVSPSQKAEIVNLVRRGNELLGDDDQGGDSNTKKRSTKSRKQQPITLAIGDGANDVSMIQTAHVGVGISGKEGVQAVNASDYAIAQFRFLKRLVLIHGRSNYQRICKVIKYSFYKNIALVVSLFLYNFFNGQSGAPLFESFVMAGWNFFLALPIIVIGVFDRDLPERVVLQYPKLYLPSQQDSDLNLPVFALTIANSAVHALIVFWVCWLCYNPSHSMFLMGTLFYSALLATMKLKVFLLTLVWNKYHLIVVGFSVWLYFFFLVVYPRMTFLSYDMFGVPVMMVKEELYWSLVAVCPLAAMLIDFTVRTAQQQFFPRAEDILRERFPAASNTDSEEDSDADGKPTLHSARSLKLMGLVPLRLGGSGVLPDKVFITDKSGMEDDHDHPRSARIKQHDPEDLESGATSPQQQPRRSSGGQPFDRYQSFQDVGHVVEADGRPVRRVSSTSNLAASRTSMHSCCCRSVSDRRLTRVA